MSVRTALVMATTVLAIGFSLAANAATPAPKNADKAACSEHVKMMEGMKTSAERDAYCKQHEDCVSHHCEKMAAAHHKKHHAKAQTKKPSANN
jgi:hypothetical protein